MLKTEIALRCIVISSNGDIDHELEQVEGHLTGVSIVDTIKGYPDRAELTKLLRSSGAHIVFVSTNSISRCAVTAERLKNLAPRTRVIAIGKFCDESVLTTLLESGCDEYLAVPFEFSCLVSALERARAQYTASSLACAPSPHAVGQLGTVASL